MKRYLKNLIAAIRGCSPYRLELDEKNCQLEKASENVRWLTDRYYETLGRWDDAEKRSESLQKLVENLRERISEKDELYTRMKKDYQGRIESYNAKIDELHAQLKRRSR